MTGFDIIADTVQAGGESSLPGGSPETTGSSSSPHLSEFAEALAGQAGSPDDEPQSSESDRSPPTTVSVPTSDDPSPEVTDAEVDQEPAEAQAVGPGPVVDEQVPSETASSVKNVLGVQGAVAADAIDTLAPKVNGDNGRGSDERSVLGHSREVPVRTRGATVTDSGEGAPATRATNVSSRGTVSTVSTGPAPTITAASPAPGVDPSPSTDPTNHVVTGPPVRDTADEKSFSTTPAARPVAAADPSVDAASVRHQSGLAEASGETGRSRNQPPIGRLGAPAETEVSAQGTRTAAIPSPRPTETAPGPTSNDLAPGVTDQTTPVRSNPVLETSGSATASTHAPLSLGQPGEASLSPSGDAATGTPTTAVNGSATTPVRVPAAVPIVATANTSGVPSEPHLIPSGGPDPTAATVTSGDGSTVAASEPRPHPSDQPVVSAGKPWVSSDSGRTNPVVGEANASPGPFRPPVVAPGLDVSTEVPGVKRESPGHLASLSLAKNDLGKVGTTGVNQTVPLVMELPLVAGNGGESSFLPLPGPGLGQGVPQLIPVPSGAVRSESWRYEEMSRLLEHVSENGRARSASVSGMAVTPAEAVTEWMGLGVRASVSQVPLNNLSHMDQLELPDQLVRAIRMQWRNGVGEAKLRLTPEHLGEVMVALSVRQGSVSAVLTADSDAVRHWIRAHQHELKSALAEQGLQLDDLVVEEDGHADQDPSRQFDRERRRPPRPIAEGVRFEVRV